MFGTIKILFATLCLAAVLSGCSTTTRDLAYDNTVQVVKRPVKQTAHLGWRIKTFWGEEMASTWRRYVSFPLLSMSRIPEINQNNPVMPREERANWLEKKTGTPSSGSVELLLNGESFFSHFEQSLLTATNRIDLKTYIFDNDDVSLQVANALKEVTPALFSTTLILSGGLIIMCFSSLPAMAVFALVVIITLLLAILFSK